VLSITVQPSGSSMPDVVLMAAVVVLTALAIAIAWRPVRTWIRSDLADAIEEYRRRGRITDTTEALRIAVPDAWARSRASDPPAA